MRLPNDFQKRYTTAEEAAFFLEGEARRIREIGKRCPGHRFKLDLHEGFACHGWKKGNAPCKLEQPREGKK